MKREDLLNAIGGVDEELLLEPPSKAQRSARTTMRLALVAAVIIALAISAGAAPGLIGKPILSSNIITGVKVAPFEMVENGDLLLDGIIGHKIFMEVEIDANPPRCLNEIYYLKLSDQWVPDGGGSSGIQSGILYSLSKHYSHKDNSGQIRLHQSVVSNYQKDNCVGTLPYLSADTAVTAEITELAGINVLRVTIPPLDWETAQKGAYCYEGETRLYWSDGKYILELDCPSWMDDKQIEAVLKGIYIEESKIEIDPSEGVIDPNVIMAADPYFHIEKGNTGTNFANKDMGLGRAIYSDGYIYYGVHKAIYKTHLETMTSACFTFKDEFWPQFLCATDKYICYTTSSYGSNGTLLIRATKDFKSREVLAKGNLGYIYVDGMDIYICKDQALNRINLETGETTLIAENFDMYFVDENYICITRGNSFSRSRKDIIDFEEHALSFKPIRILVKGEDVYFSARGSYQIIRYRDGVEEPLPVYSYYFQILGDKLIYNDATYYTDHNWTVHSYDMKTGETVPLQEGVYNFYILNERYILFNLNGKNENIIVGTAGSDKWTILDTQTGNRKNLT